MSRRHMQGLWVPSSGGYGYCCRQSRSGLFAEAFILYWVQYDRRIVRALHSSRVFFRIEKIKKVASRPTEVTRLKDYGACCFLIIIASSPYQAIASSFPNSIPIWIWGSHWIEILQRHCHMLKSASSAPMCWCLTLRIARFFGGDLLVSEDVRPALLSSSLRMRRILSRHPFFRK